MFVRFVLFLIGASVLGCARETEPVPAAPKTPNEFVAMGPVQTEEKAISTAWRFILSEPDLYLAAPITFIEQNENGDPIEYVDIMSTSSAIDASQTPRVLDHRGDEYGGWVVIWTSRDAGFMIPFAIDAATGQTEPLISSHGPPMP